MDPDRDEETRRQKVSASSTGAETPHKQGSLDGVLVKDRYRIEKELGRGGFAITYLASDTQLDSRPVVVKILLEHQADDPWVLKKFHQEMRALARLDHPGVVGALDSGQLPDGKPFLVMQFIRGVRLRDVINPRGMDLERVANIVRQLGQALSVAHQEGTCHRDVKPENIMLQSLGEGEEQAKLIDFGIASIRDPRTATSGDSTKISGSWGYMAPEQFEGKSLPASDVYALGVVAYEMVTGRTPFNADSPAQLMMMHLQGAKVKPKDLRPSLPEAAQDAIWKALSKNPEDRHARARDFGEAFARTLSFDPGHARSVVDVEARTVPAPSEEPPGESLQPSLETAHVLFMDMVGYAKLPLDQQRKHVQLLQWLVRETPEFRKAQADRELMSLPAGDGMALVFFRDPIAAAQCALSIAAALKSYPDLKLRMGLHTGPVYRVPDINANSNVAGGGINVAQRVMDCGDAGHILLSRSIAEVIGQLGDLAPHLQDLGEHTVKHGARVHLYSLCTGDLGNPAMPEKLSPPQRSAAEARERPHSVPAWDFRALPTSSQNWYRFAWSRAAVVAVMLAVAGGSVTLWMLVPAARQRRAATQENLPSVATSAAPPVSKNDGKPAPPSTATAKIARKEALPMPRAAVPGARERRDATLDSPPSVAKSPAPPGSKDSGAPPSSRTAEIVRNEPPPRVAEPKPPSEAPAESPPRISKDADIAYWSSIRDKNDPEALEAYLRRFPEGEFSEMAAASLRQLRVAASLPVTEVGVYYKKGDQWAELFPEIVNWKTGGVLKGVASAGIVKGDVNGQIPGLHSRNSVETSLEFLIHTPEGVSITEYQLLRLRTQKEAREFRTVRGRSPSVPGSATGDLIPFEATRVANRSFLVVLPSLAAGEYGFLLSRAVMSSHSSSSLGKVYTFRIPE